MTNISNCVKMGDTDYLEAELVSVDDELEEIEVQIGDLLERQQMLNDRAQEIRNLLSQVDASSSNAVSSHDVSNHVTDLEQWEKTDFPWSAKVDKTRNDVFHIQHFRQLQLSSINATLSGKDSLLIMPTGGGKSLCYQLPALVSKGITLVISPLVSLMEDQLMHLQDLGVDAALLNASSTKEEVNRVQTAMVDKNATLKLLYVTPEKISKSKRFMAKVEKMYTLGRMSLIAIDEVHCCSQWGHDFRPDYKILGILKRQFPKCPILGVTATATQRVLDDVKKILNLPHCLVLRASFNRPNLYYEVHPKPSSQNEMMDEMQKIIQKRFKDKSGIVYCFSRNDTEAVSRDLQSRGIRASCYHAQLDAKYRKQVHKKWVDGKVQVIVATVAFGMGIDKPDVRFVIHHSLSKSMENYYQESGRAGRDDAPSACILYFRFADIFRQSTMVFTEQTGMENIYRMVKYCLENVQCRRSLIAGHFGERWDISDCNRNCDHCSNRDKMKLETRDVTSEYREVMSVLQKKSTKEKRLTGLKLSDFCRAEKGRLAKLGTHDTDRVIGQMLMDGYLKEDFHFTPYNTISYVVSGPRASSLNSSKDRPISMKFTSRIYSSSTTSLTTSPTKQKSTSKSADFKTKPKLRIINPEKSKFTSSTVTKPTESMSENDIEIIDDIVKFTPKKTENSKIILVDLEELDFDDDDLAPSSASRSTKRKEPKAVLESDAKKIRLQDDGGDEVDGKKKKSERARAVSSSLVKPGEESSSENDVSEEREISRRIRRRRKLKTKKRISSDIPSSEPMLDCTSEIATVAKETAIGTGTGSFGTTESSLGDCSTIVRGIFKRLRRERETLSASLGTENSQENSREQSVRLLKEFESKAENPHTKSLPTTSIVEDFSDVRLSKSAELVASSDSVCLSWSRTNYDNKSSDDEDNDDRKHEYVELDEKRDENSNEISGKSEDELEAEELTHQRRYCWGKSTNSPSNSLQKPTSDPVTRNSSLKTKPPEILIVSSSDSDSESDLEKSEDEMNELYQVYADQLSTLAVKDDSDDDKEENSKKVLKNDLSASMALTPIVEQSESDFSSPRDKLNLPQTSHGVRMRSNSGESVCSIDESMQNLNKLEAGTLVLTSIDDSDPDAEMTQIHDVYVNQLGGIDLT